MQVDFTNESGRKLAITEIAGAPNSRTHLIWGHGWGHSGASLAPIAEALKPFASSSLIDFPGFGRSPDPPSHWGTAEYADFVNEWLGGLPAVPLIWIGHSLGGRIGIQLAARHPARLAGMVLIASAGLQRRRSLAERARFNARKTTFQIARKFVREGNGLDRLRQRFGSSDYRAAGNLRPILVRIVREDLTPVAATVQCPTLLLYGSADTDTPPEIGMRLNKLIRNSDYATLDGFNHLSILTEGRHQVALRIRKFLELHQL